MSEGISIDDAIYNATLTGMEISYLAGQFPDRTAIISEHGNRTYAELNDRINQVSRLLRNLGLQPGDPIAMVCGNRPEFAEIRYAAHRSGLRLTPVNWHLGGEELQYVVDNCEARVLFVDIRCADRAAEIIAGNSRLELKLAFGGALEGYGDYEEALSGLSTEDIDNPELGTLLLYTSGTTGRPKGVLREPLPPEFTGFYQKALADLFNFDRDADDMVLATGPLYHSGPINFCLTAPVSNGVGVVMMDKWEAEKMLSLIDQYRVSHTFCVPTMFSRLLALPPAVRDKYDISSLRFIVHGAAPCSVELKKQMIDWVGPILLEAMAGTEGQGTLVTSEEWLKKPGTLGKPAEGQLLILDDQGDEVPRGESGTLWWKMATGKFEYYKSEEKTRESLRDDYFTAGDIGYVDEDGYLFLSGRTAELIISGGVNIYPQEIDDVLTRHPAVLDAACVGVPDEDWGEAVKALVQLRDGIEQSEVLADELIAYCGDHLAKQKLPRSVDFIDEIPRSDAGKVYRKRLRDRFWEGRERAI